MKPLTARQKQFSQAHLDMEARDLGLANERQIYGPLFPMVQYLRPKGWVIFREGMQFRVGTKLGSENLIREVYQREKDREERSARISYIPVDTDRPKGKKKARKNTVLDKKRRRH